MVAVAVELAQHREGVSHLARRRPEVVGEAAEGVQAPEAVAEGEQGRIYRGALKFEVEKVDLAKFARPRTKMMLNVGNPEQAFSTAMLPNDGVGLARMEFIFASWVKVHPLALTRCDELDLRTRAEVDALTRGYQDKTDYFVDRLARRFASERITLVRHRELDARD